MEGGVRMKQKILIVSHCFLNDAAKLKNRPVGEQEEERDGKREFLKKILDDGLEIIQLPCPEFYLYGSERWGHASSQFDHPFYRKAVREMLEPIVLQLEGYLEHPEQFDVAGVVGIDGSPSCGVHFTYDGAWGGEFSGPKPVEETLATLKQEEKPGVLMQVFQEMLKERQIHIPFYSMQSFLKEG